MRRRRVSRSSSPIEPLASLALSVASSRSSRAASVRRLCDWSSSSALQPTRKSRPHDSQARSLWRPISVGAMEPVGITKASASNARNKSASVNAITTDSTVSRPKPSGLLTMSPGRGGLDAAGAAGLVASDVAAARGGWLGRWVMMTLAPEGRCRCTECKRNREFPHFPDRSCRMTPCPALNTSATSRRNGYQHHGN